MLNILDIAVVWLYPPRPNLYVKILTLKDNGIRKWAFGEFP